MSSDYTLVRTNKLNDLEVLYNMHLCSGEVNQAYEVLGKLMKYRLIEKDDPRLDKKFKLFKSAGISPTHRFLYDYRRDYNYLAQSIYFETPRQFTFELVGEEHWGKRIEGGYEGDVIVPEKIMKFSATQVNTAITVTRALEDIGESYKEEYRKTINLQSELNDLLSGESKLYRISLCSGYNAIYKELGYILFYVGTDSIVAKLFLNHKRIKGDYIDLLEAYRIISIETHKAFKDAGNSVKLRVGALCSLDNIKKQAMHEKAMREKEREERK